MIPSWKSPLSSAIHRNRSKPYSRYFQLATVTTEGYPANRTVVFRGFMEDKRSSLKIITDIRSAKIKEIEHQSLAEICWYFTKTREQFRISGNLRLVTFQETDPSLQKVRKITWHNLSDSARSQFAWADPGQPLSNKSAFDVDLLDPKMPLDNFCLLLLIPTKVDHLQLKGDPQQRCIYKLEADSTWSSQLVNP